MEADDVNQNELVADDVPCPEALDVMGQAAPIIPQSDTASDNANSSVAAEPSQSQQHQ